jgi:hypothetical protein
MYVSIQHSVNLWNNRGTIGVDSDTGHTVRNIFKYVTVFFTGTGFATIDVQMHNTL